MKNRFIFSITFLLLTKAILANIAVIKSTIKGEITGMPDHIKIYLIKNNGSSPDTLQTATILNEHFMFEVNVAKNGEMVFIKIDTNSTYQPALNTETWTRIIVDKANINIKSDINDWPKIRTDSRSTELFDSLNKILQDKLSLTINEIRTNKGNDKIIDDLKDKFNTFLSEIVVMNKNEIVAPFFAAKFGSNLSLHTQDSLYSQLSTEVKESAMGEIFNNSIKRNKIKSRIKENEVLPNIIMLDSSGKNINILNIASKNKLTLIDFWASWCVPCRDEFPKMRLIYEKYRNQGFEIIGVSTDRSKEQWKKALIEENNNWIQCSDNVENPLFKLLEASSLPAYLLLDNSGKLIAYEVGLGKIKSFGPKIRGNSLKITIDSILKKYDQ